MGVLQRFERRLGGLVDNVFPKVFKGGVEPVEIAGALARETDEHRAPQRDGRGRTVSLVPNQFEVELASQDYVRLAEYARPLCDELEQMVREHGSEQDYTFVGPVSIRLAEARDLDVGVFRIRSWRDEVLPPAGGGRPAGPRPEPGVARLLITNKEAPPGQEREYPLTDESTLIGRSTECVIRLTDTGVSRQHGRIDRMPDGNYLYVDAGSTNGSIVNGRPARQAKLVDGDLIELGTALITFRREDARGMRPGAERDARERPEPFGRPAERRPSDEGRAPRPEPARERDRPSPRSEPYGDRSSPRNTPYGDRSSPRNEPHPGRERSDSRNEPRPDRDRSGSRNEPYRDSAREGGRARQDGDRDRYTGSPGAYGGPRRSDASGPRPARDPGGAGRAGERAGRGPDRDSRDDDVHDAETRLPGRSAARPRPGDDRPRPSGPPATDRSW